MSTWSLSIFCFKAVDFGPGIGLVLITGSFGSLLINAFEFHNAVFDNKNDNSLQKKKYLLKIKN